jgi:hypothetical protein
MGRSCLQLVEDGVTDPLTFSAQARIPEAKGLNAQACQGLVAFRVVLLLAGKSMPGTVQLDSQSRLFAKEIQIVDPDRVLPPEFVAVETAGSQPTPHQFFGPG